MVVILTSSELESDILAAYRLRCNSFVVKPVDFNAFTKSIDMLIDSWFTLAALPARAV